MELAYVLIAALIVVLPFILARIFTARTKRTTAATATRPGRGAGAAQSAQARIDPLRAQVASLLVQGGKMEAIKLVRESRRLSLAAAKEAVETIAREDAIVAPAPGLAATIQRAQEMSEQVRRLAATGKKTEAVKLLREKSGLGLKEARELVDRLG